MGFFRYAKLAYFSKETGDRKLFRLIKGQQTERIVLLGIESVRLCESLIEVASQYARDEQVLVTGLDAFDERDPSLDQLRLVDAHRELSQTGARVQLTPGGPSEGLARMANSLQDTDLVLISRLVSEQRLTAAWFYLPRMCHPGTIVLQQTQDSTEKDAWRQISLDEINALAATRRRSAA